MSKSISKMNKKELYEECKKLKQENLGLSFDLNVIQDELTEIYAGVGKIIENENIPRFSSSVVFELHKLKSQNELLYDQLNSNYIKKEKQVMNIKS
eukprot:SAG11_NODE_1159_length_5656_cov_5.909942_4_plen_96_part_00